MIGQKPLDGIRVLDLTRVLAGPFCTMNLADLGAEVIKIELPGHGDDSRHFAPMIPQSEDSGYFYSVNRGKRSVTIDLRTGEGRAIFIELAARSDVVVENFSPGTIERFDLGYQALAAANPKIILCSISGFGQTGPMATAPAYDIVAQALGGTMSITGLARGRSRAMRRFDRRSRRRALRHDRDPGRVARARSHRDGTASRHRVARLPGGDARGRAGALFGLGQCAAADRLAPSVDHAVSAVQGRRRSLRRRGRQRKIVGEFLRRDRAQRSQERSALRNQPRADRAPAGTRSDAEPAFLDPPARLVARTSRRAPACRALRSRT